MEIDENSENIVNEFFPDFEEISEKPERSRTKSSQFKKLFAFFETHSDFTKCKTSQKQAAEWEALTDELNLLGPPTYSSKRWRKVWSDHKGNTKRKGKSDTASQLNKFIDSTLPIKKRCLRTITDKNFDNDHGLATMQFVEDDHDLCTGKIVGHDRNGNKKRKVAQSKKFVDSILPIERHSLRTRTITGGKVVEDYHDLGTVHIVEDDRDLSTREIVRHDRNHKSSEKRKVQRVTSVAQCNKFSDSVLTIKRSCLHDIKEKIVDDDDVDGSEIGTADSQDKENNAKNDMYDLLTHLKKSIHLQTRANVHTNKCLEILKMKFNSV